jgi:hypothetical protein
VEERMKGMLTNGNSGESVPCSAVLAGVRNMALFQDYIVHVRGTTICESDGKCIELEIGSIFLA